MRIGGNEYNLRELAGAFGDLGTLIPFLVGYITIMQMDPVGVLVGFGFFKILVGLYFKTPVPIQPMKAIGTAAISHAGALPVGAIWGAGLFSGLFWLIMGLTGAVTWIAKITSRPVVQGIILGLGLAFILEGVKMMQANPLLFFADSVATLFKLFPRALLGVILLFGGLELAAGVQEHQFQKAERYVMLLTAGVSMWNMGIGYAAGLGVGYAFQRGWLKA